MLIRSRLGAETRLHRPAEAIAELARVHAAEPDEPATLRALALAHARLGRSAEAINWARTALRLNPDDPAQRRLLQELGPGQP